MEKLFFCAVLSFFLLTGLIPAAAEPSTGLNEPDTVKNAALYNTRKEDRALLEAFSKLDSAKIRNLEKRIEQEKRDAFFTGNMPGENIPYKMRVFSDSSYRVNDVIAQLPSFISQLPAEKRPLFEEASSLLKTLNSKPQKWERPHFLTFEETAHAWKNYLSTAQVAQLAPGDKNPFLLPELSRARVILLGEDHTMHYPTEQMVEYLIDYNKNAPEGEKITHLFVEFSYQSNIAMAFIKQNIDKFPEEELLTRAIVFARKNFSKSIRATLREEARWLRLGYRLLQEQVDVVFYAYDIPSSSIVKRNDAAKAFLLAGYAQPNTKMVFITGALHSLRHNIATPLFAHPDINAPDSLANTPGVAPEDIVSILTVGGQPWEEDSPLYGGTTKGSKELYEVLIDTYKDTHKNLAFKTPANLFGFDYYFYFDASKKAAITDMGKVK